LSPGGPHSSSSSSSSSFGVHNDIELALHYLHDGEDDIMGSSPSFSGILQWVAVGGGQPDVDNEDAASAEFVEMHSGQEASSLSMVVSSGGSITGRGPQAPLPPKCCEAPLSPPRKRMKEEGARGGRSTGEHPLGLDPVFATGCFVRQLVVIMIDEGAWVCELVVTTVNLR
jgi:hypothetical protein